MAEKKRKVWSREETLGFLRCYIARKDEFKHTRKKRFAYQHVYEDMVYQDIADCYTTVSSLESRMRTLLMAYKSWKENGETAPSGEIPRESPIYYMKLMEEIFGDDPSIFKESSSTDLNTTNSGPSLQIDCDPLVSKSAIEELNKPKRKNISKDEYYNMKLELKRRHLQKTEKQREEHLRDMRASFNDHLKKMFKMEKKKVDLLQEFLNNKPLIKPEPENSTDNNGFI